MHKLSLVPPCRSLPGFIFTAASTCKIWEWSGDKATQTWELCSIKRLNKLLVSWKVTLTISDLQFTVLGLSLATMALNGVLRRGMRLYRHISTWSWSTQSNGRQWIHQIIKICWKKSIWGAFMFTLYEYWHVLCTCGSDVLLHTCILEVYTLYFMHTSTHK